MNANDFDALSDWMFKLEMVLGPNSQHLELTLNGLDSIDHAGLRYRIDDVIDFVVRHVRYKPTDDRPETVAPVAQD